MAESDEQRDRRQRILDSTAALASRGGFDAVQMRAVAAGAPVALGTLYRYFPSKVHLLVALLEREVERSQDRLDRAILRGDTPYDRLMVTLGGFGKSMQRDPLLTEAMTRALMSADATAAADVSRATALIDQLFARAMSNGDPSDDHLAIARVIADVWLANQLAWLTGRASADEVASRLELTANLLLGRDRSPAPR